MNTSRRVFLKSSAMALAAAKVGAMGTGEENGILCTGFRDLDQAIGGFRAGELIIIASCPLEGRTAFARNIALNAAKQGKSVAIPYTSGIPELTMPDLLAAEAEIPRKKVFDGTLSVFEQERLALAEDSISNMKLFFSYNDVKSMADIRANCHKIKAEAGLDLIIVEEPATSFWHVLKREHNEERLKLLRAERKSCLKMLNPIENNSFYFKRLRSINDEIDKLCGKDYEQQYLYTSQSLKALAEEFNVPVIAFTWITRKTDTPPCMADLSRRKIARHADTVLFLYRKEYHNLTYPYYARGKCGYVVDDYYNNDTENKGIAEIIIAKHPYASGSVYLRHGLEKYKFYTLGEV